MKKILWALLAGCVLSQPGIGQQSNLGGWATLSTNGNPTARHEAAMVAFDGKA